MLPPINLFSIPPMTNHPSIRKAILDEASSIVNGERASTYGGPEDSFSTIASLWSSWLDKKVSTSDVAIMLAMLKMARLKKTPKHRDSWVDMAGYAACGAECELKEQLSWQLKQHAARLEMEQALKEFHGLAA